LKKEVKYMSEYSIANFLEALAEDDLEREIIRLIFKGFTEEKLLQKILEVLVEEEEKK